MKKVYIEPITKVAFMVSESFMAGSPGDVKDNGNGTGSSELPDPEEPGHEGDLDAKHHSIWEE